MTNETGLEVAVVGMALRLPQAAQADEFWAHLAAGRELVRFLPDELLARHGVTQAELSHPAYVKVCGSIDAPFQFDHEFFGYSAREAEFMDPQLRLLHECCWEALESAGCDPLLHDDAIGLYSGAAQNLHWLKAVSQHIGADLSEVYDLKMLYQREFFNSRIAYRLNFKGPAITLDTTCSTSLVAVHMAAQGLLSGDCDIALAGGACISPLTKGYLYHEGMIQSPDGHCRPFDAQAKGTVPGQGVGIVALKRLNDAIAAGDPIHAVLRATAINNDGNDKVGYTAPSVSGQNKVIRLALKLAELTPQDIDFVECHGTATRIGDPIEVEALAQAYAQRSRAVPCRIGSVKSNLGHLDTAAGVIGLIKTVLSVRERQLPASLHYSQANPLINFAASPLMVNAALTDLQREDRPVRGAVSSFGIGGTNAHAIVEQYLEARPASVESRRYRLVPLSARTQGALSRYAAKLASALLLQRPDIDALARTLQCRRRHFPLRHALIATHSDDLLQQLLAFAKQGAPTGVPFAASECDLVFMFPGQGAQYSGMTRELYRHEPEYRRRVDQSLALLAPQLAERLRELLLCESSAAADAVLARTDVAQPLLFIVSHALAQVLLDLGVEPRVMIGHSLGEYVAACLAGVFSLPDALRLVCERGRLMAAAAPGAMLSVQLSAREVQCYLSDAIELAADNSSSLVVLSGEAGAIAATQQQLEQRGVACTRLQTSHAYHSRMMQTALHEFRNCLASVTLQAPQRPYISNRTGTLVTEQQATDPEYWCAHLRHTVCFTEALEGLLQQRALCIEIGPGSTLSTFVKGHTAFAASRHRCLQSVRHPRQAQADDWYFQHLLAELHVAGVALDWTRIATRGPAIALPTYAFETTVHDQVIGRNSSAAASVASADPAPVVREICNPRPQLAVPYLAAGSDTEQQLCEIWQRLFKLDRVGIADDFFQLGGHSLLATRLLALIRERLGINVALRVLFEGPTIQQLAGRVIEAAGAAAGKPALVRVGRDAPIAASFQQRRLWIIDKLSAGSAQYNMPAPFILVGELNRAAVQASLDTVIARHESLRSNFCEIDGEPFQVIRPPTSIAIAELDLSELPAEQRLQRRQELIREDALRPFDLERDSLIRITLVKLAANEHLLLFNIHHIVSDGWSEVAIVREFRELYGAQVTARQPQLPALDLQYPDYAAWQRNWLRGEVLENELAFWRERLAGVPAVHQLPLDKPRPKTANHRGAVLRRKLPHEVMQQLKQLAQQQSATLFMALQSCFAALLGRWSNAEDVVMGTPVAGREQRELEPLVGFFVNTLVLRNDLSGNPSFAELLRRTRDMALTAFEHQHVPWEMLVEALVPGRSLQHAPLFQILFALQNYERSTLSLEGLELQRVEATVAARFDLTLITAEADDGLFTDWYYDTELFEAQTIERLADQYALLLSAVVAEPEAALLGLEIVSKTERQRLLGDFQHWQRFEYRQQHVLDEFIACAQRTPHAIAVSDACSELSYGELQRRSNQLAHHLIECGVQEHGLVAVCAGAGVEVMVAIFAVLKCGAGYVPLDPKYPAERLNYVLQDSGAGTLLVDDAAHSAMLGWQGPLVDLASPAVQQQIERCPGADIELERHARAGERPAYLIYTSGSTGKPKGTLIRQQPLVASLVARFASYPAPVRCSLLSSSISFDASITSIFWTLLSGGRLHICDDRERKDPAATAALIERLAVSHYVALPSFYSAVLDAFDGKPLTGQSLEIVVLAGEALPTEVQEKHFAHPSVRSALYNEYGPTECSVWSTLYRCEREPEPRPVPIGHSPGHARLYVLNPVRALVPIGVEGELYIGGDGVAEGYLHRPELSAERFLHDPLAEVPNARMYRSGDRVRWRKDGEIEFLGRMDHQVKLRGYRIELGEVETAVARYAGVAQAVVRIVDERLVAYVCGAAALAEPAAAQQIRSFVAERLPDYMVPQWVVVLDAMPLLPNGKVAVGQLPAAVPQAAVNQLKLPHTAREQELLALWREVLKAESISTDQDFFALGGDSILLLRLSAQLARRNLKFSVRDFYGQPTIEHMALLLQSTDARADADETISGVQLLHPIQRWFLEGDDTDLHHFNQSLLVHAPGTLSLAILQQLVAAVYQRHDVLRLQFGREAAGRWQAAYRALDPALIESSCLQLDVGVEPGESLSDAVARTAQQIQESLSLQGPLLKVAHLRLPDGTARLLLVAHHLIVDGVSWRILLSDLQQAATQLLAGEPARLAAKSVSYQSVVRRLQEHAQTDAVLREVPYWQSVLAARFDFEAEPAANCTVADEAQATLTLPVETTRALLQDCQRAYGMTVEEVLLSALSLAVWRWRGWRRTALILEGHGRSILPELDCADTVGWFTSQYPLVLEGCPEDLSAQLRATKQQLRGVPARGQHYGLLQSLATEQGLGADHAWHERGITFNYLGQFDASAGGTAHFAPAAERTGNNVSPRRARTGAIVFDGLVSNAQLRFSIRYTRGQFEAAAIQALATCYREALQELIAHWSQRDLTTPTRADFPLLQLEETELDEWQRRWPALLDAYPATPVQQGMIFHTLRDAGHGGSTYLSQVFMDIHGALDVPRFEAAWQHVLQQYEVFRTALVPLQRGGVAQVVLPSGAVRLPCVVTDVSQHDVTEQRVQLERAAAADRAQPFDFAQPPLLRVALWKLDATHHRLLFTAHHAVIDGWSLPLVFNSLLQGYRQGATQAASAPSFKRYLEWLQVQDTTAAKAHWREQLVQLDAPCLIRPDLGPGEGATPGVAALLRRVDRAQVAQLTAAARAAGVTLYALVQAAWAYVLHTYTSLDTVVFGSVTSGRPATLPHAERMVGLFINTLPVAIAVEFEQSLQRWIQHIHRQQLSGQAFEYLPLAEILKVSPVGAAKLFNTVLVYQNYPLESAGTTDAATQAATDLRISNVYSDESTEADLTLVVMPSKAGLTLKLLAQRHSLSEGFSERLLQQFERVLMLIPTCMTEPVAALDATAPRTGAEDEDLELLALLSEAGATAELQLLTP